LTSDISLETTEIRSREDTLELALAFSIFNVSWNGNSLTYQILAKRKFDKSWKRDKNWNLRSGENEQY